VQFTLQDPELSKLPFNAPCLNCIEDVRKRGATSRLFIDNEKSNRCYIQESFLPIHYRNNESDYWSLIDFRLRPDVNVDGRYIADRQPVVSICDLNEKNTSLVSGNSTIVFNNQLSLHLETIEGEILSSEKGAYNQFTIGEQGLAVKKIWNGIDMQQVFGVGEVKSSYVIEKPLQFPITEGWLVIEDFLQLSAGCTIEEEKPVNKTADGFYKGSYWVKGKQGELLFAYHSAVFFDSRLVGMQAKYKLRSRGEGYILQMYIPVEWLLDTTLSYPLTIDPIVNGFNQYGNYAATGLPSAQMGFTSEALGSCDYHLTVKVPGKSQLKTAFAELEYQLTYDADCGDPNIPAPFCTFSQVSMEVVSDSCQQSSGLLICNPSMPPWTGTCTTDSNLVPSAHPIDLAGVNPLYLSCLPIQIDSYAISFTLKNRDSICGDVCGYLCARGNMWRMTVVAETVDSLTSIIQSGNHLSNCLQVSPNPAQSQLDITVCDELTGGSIVVYDLLGRALKSIKLNNAHTLQSVDDLSKGVYTIVATTPFGLRLTDKLVKQ
jgi:hypothetical protein